MNKPTLKPIHEQVIVITGASSGIGLATAKLAAARGAKVVLAARSQDASEQILEEVTKDGGYAVFVPCDVSSRPSIDRLVQVAIETFGRIDTWVNNAGVSIYGRIDEVSERDARLLFETNFWGIYHGSLAALPHLISSGGALINLGCEVSDAVVPLQGIYTASKHAVKGFTDSLRVEIVEIDQKAISITLIQPGATDTPFPQHARNYMDREPKLPDPLDDPEDVAKAILDAAVEPVRDKKVGGSSKVNALIAKMMPGMGDKMAAKQADRQRSNQAPQHPEGTLENPSESVGSVGKIKGGARVEEDKGAP